MSQKRASGTALLETCMVVIPLLIVGTGGVELFRLFRAQRSLSVAVIQAAEEYRRPTKTSENRELRVRSAKDAWTRAINVYSPSLPQSCAAPGACAEVRFNEEIIDGRTFINVDGLMRVRSLFFRSSFYELDKHTQMILEDGQATISNPVQFDNNL